MSLKEINIAYNQIIQNNAPARKLKSIFRKNIRGNIELITHNFGEKVPIELLLYFLVCKIINKINYKIKVFFAK